MRTTREQIAYLRGMLDGGGSFDENRMRTVISNLLDILDSLADDVDDIAWDQQELEEYVEAVDDDLNELEEQWEDEDEDDDCDCHCGCPGHHDQDEYVAQCPHCGKTVHIDAQSLEDSDVILCPYCQEIILDCAGIDEEDDDEDNGYYTDGNGNGDERDEK